jgi:hypothetical protein
MRFGVFILIVILSACSSKQITSLPASNTEKPDQSSTQQSTKTTENTDPYLLGISSEIKQASQIEIANKLFILWLDHFLKTDTDIFTHLDEYEIVNIAISNEWQYCASKLGVDFIAEGMFSVKPANGLQSWWWAGGGNSEDSVWITKLFVAAIAKSDNFYTLQILGVPPC